jgi:uncharacterized protein (UPF0276 family)
MSQSLPRLGVGLGYRLPLHHDILAHRGKIDFLELITEQFIHSTPEKIDHVMRLKNDFPLIPHGVELSVGTALPLDGDYLAKVKSFVQRTGAAWFSDHLSFTKVADADVGQLTPLWFTEESCQQVCRNVRQVKRAVEAPFLLENITYYFPIPDGDMSEAEFVTRVLEDCDIGMLLDINNVHINSMNLGLDPYAFLRAIPLERVVQVHIAGGHPVMGMIVDTHGNTVREEVWELLRFVVGHAPVKAILLEWDQDFPPFQHLVDHLDRARAILAS